jgi:hypothetical protein
MPKTKLSDIFKNGEKFKVKKLDPNDPEVKKMLRAVIKEQKRIKDSAKVSRRNLDNIVINI